MLSKLIDTREFNNAFDALREKQRRHRVFHKIHLIWLVGGLIIEVSFKQEARRERLYQVETQRDWFTTVPRLMCAHAGIGLSIHRDGNRGFNGVSDTRQTGPDS